MDYLILPKPADIRGARNYLNWNQIDLADRCDVNVTTVTSIEKEKSRATKGLLEKIAKVFIEQGIYFLPSGGFEVDKSMIKIYKGEELYSELQDDVMRVCGINKDEVLLLGSDERKISWETFEKDKKVYDMGIYYKSIIAKNDDFMVGPLKDYRRVDKNLFPFKDVIVIYGNKIVLPESFDDIDCAKSAIAINNTGIAEQFRNYFYRLWDMGEEPKKSSQKQILFKKKK